MWDAATGNVVGRWADHDGVIMALAFRPDGRGLATGGLDGVVKLRELPSGKVVATWKQPARVMSLAFDARGDRLAVGLEDDRLALWGVKAGRLERTIRLPAKLIRSVAFRRGDGLLEGCSVNGVLQAWRPATGEPVFTLNSFRDYTHRSGFLGDGRVLMTAGDEVSGKKSNGVVRLWDPGNAKERAVLHGPTVDDAGAVSCLAATEDGSVVAAGSMDGHVYFWSPETQRGLARLEAHKGGVRAVAFSPDGTRLATAGKDGVVKLWRVARER